MTAFIGTICKPGLQLADASFTNPTSVEKSCRPKFVFKSNSRLNAMSQRVGSKPSGQFKRTINARHNYNPSASNILIIIIFSHLGLTKTTQE